MYRRTPPLQAIQAFLVAVHAPSFRAAADELNLSPSAFSRRISTLEVHLGLRLFDRTGPRPVLTPAGRAYCQRIEPAVETIRRASVELHAQGDDGVLRVLAPHSLTMNWLLPMLAQVSDAERAGLSLSVGRALSALYTGVSDIGIVVGPRELHGLPAEPLIEIHAGVVAAPALADGADPPQSLDAIAHHTLLAPGDPPHIWRQWLGRTGAPGDAPLREQCYDTVAMSYEAAAAGLGLALGLPLHIDRYVQEDRLRFCVADAPATGYRYMLVYANAATRRRPDARRFAERVRHAAALSQQRFARALRRARRTGRQGIGVGSGDG